MLRFLVILALLIARVPAHAQNWSQVLAPGQYPGSTVAPCSGCIGEVQKQAIAGGAAIALTTNTGAAIVSKSIPAGHWSCQGQIEFSGNAATTVTWAGAQISTASGAVNDSQVGVVFQTYGGATIFAAGIPVSYAVSPAEFLFTIATTVFVSAKAVFLTNSMASYGGLYCVRIS